mgnify:CR=1 FL=1
MEGKQKQKKHGTAATLPIPTDLTDFTFAIQSDRLTAGIEELESNPQIKNERINTVVALVRKLA